MPDDRRVPAPHPTPRVWPIAIRRWAMLAAIGFGVAAVLTLIAAVPSGAATGPAARGDRLWSGADLAVASDGWLPLEPFLQLHDASEAEVHRLLDQVDAHWRSGYASMLMEAARFAPRARLAVATRLGDRIIDGPSRHRNDLWRSVWKAAYHPHPRYAEFKSRLYRPIDPRFANYFDDAREATIRLDEVRWGGVRRDGIPPLDKPKMLAAGDASYLADTDVVFGIEINGDARAYPKRILAWHEMFKDTVGGVSLCGVYCTLCGMVIPYETLRDGVHHELGTSGFLYRSNKLMYDHATESMWSTTKGEPVIGPLVGKEIKLKTRPVVTTSWGEWRRRHPETTVLSLDTGHRRDYGEGVAYAEYFATDRLMFTVPDFRKPAAEPVANKQQVLALRFGDADAAPVAIRADFLQANPIYHGVHGDQAYVVVTSPTGANRVYASGGRRFARPPTAEGDLSDGAGGSWTVREDRLVGPGGAELPRLSAHRAFWFGWRAAHPDTLLIGE